MTNFLMIAENQDFLPAAAKSNSITHLTPKEEHVNLRPAQIVFQTRYKFKKLVKHVW